VAIRSRRRVPRIHPGGTDGLRPIGALGGRPHRREIRRHSRGNRGWTYDLPFGSYVDRGAPSREVGVPLFLRPVGDGRRVVDPDARWAGGAVAGGGQADLRQPVGALSSVGDGIDALSRSRCGRPSVASRGRTRRAEWRDQLALRGRALRQWRTGSRERRSHVLRGNSGRHRDSNADVAASARLLPDRRHGWVRPPPAEPATLAR
jgi:hypothetical protein